jgi:lantibiotic biosynthesis protein
MPPEPDRTARLARRVADRLTDGLRVDRGADPHPSPDASLSHGNLGVAVALWHAGHVLAEPRYRGAAVALLRRAAASTADSPLTHPGLSDGTAGFAWAVAEFARREPGYLGTLRRVGLDLTDQLRAAPLSPPGTFLYDCDVLRGSAGQLGAVLAVADTLDAGAHADGGAPLRQAAEPLVERLLAATDTEAGVPGWFVPADRYASVQWRQERFPCGLYDLGFAHGLSGVLAALTRAGAAGIGGERVVARVRGMVDWLLEHAMWGATGPSWPAILPADPVTRLPVPGSESPGRSAWCYGPPGVATALLPAAVLLGDAEVHRVGVAALDRAAVAGPFERSCVSPTFCHGHAGLVAVYARAHRQTGSPGLAAARDAAIGAIAATARDEYPFVVPDVPEPGLVEHDPGLLSGAAGVLLALVDAIAPTGGPELLLITPEELGSRSAPGGDRSSPVGALR